MKEPAIFLENFVDEGIFASLFKSVDSTQTGYKQRQVALCNKGLGFDPTAELSAKHWLIANNI